MRTTQEGAMDTTDRRLDPYVPTEPAVDECHMPDAEHGARHGIAPAGDASTSSRRRCGAALAAAALVLAAGIFAAVLFSSRPRPGGAHQQIVVENGELADFDEGSGDGAGWSGEEREEMDDWSEDGADGLRSSSDGVNANLMGQPPGDEDEEEGVDLSESASSDYEDFEWGELQSEASYFEAYEYSDEMDDEIALLPEDCDSDDCEHSNDNVSVFKGPISDFMIGDAALLARSGRNDPDLPPSSALRSTCKTNERPATFVLDTDDYGFETSWKIIQRDNNAKVRASGPPPERNYARNTRYAGRLCLPPGQYILQVNDKAGDGLCCTHGNGKARVVINGRTVAQTGNEKFRERKYPFVVAPVASGGGGSGSGSNGGGGNANNSNNNNVNNRPINSGKECAVVKPIDYNRKFQRGSGYDAFPGYQCYRTVEGTKKTVDDLVAKYPNLARKVNLPYPTWEKKQRLYALVATNRRKGGPKGKLLLLSSIHAREIATSETVIRWAEYLVQNYDKDPEVKWILDYNEVHIIPQGNPDGRQYVESEGGGLWKKNRNDSENCDSSRHGVDVNRNFPFKWSECDDSDGSQRCAVSSDCSSVVYRGPSPRSEQETKAITQYAASIFPASQRKGSLQQSERKWNVKFPDSNQGVFIDVHSFGEDVGWPWGFVNKKTPNDDAMGALGRKFASFNEYSLWAPEMKNRKYGLDGGSFDTVYGWLGVPSFFLEVGTSFYPPCADFPNVVNQVFPALMYAAKVAREPMTAPRGPDVLCTTISSTRRNNAKYISVRVQVSDNARARHADDDGSIFPSGRQNIRSVEIFVNCHPYSGSNCRPAARRNLPNAGRTATVKLEFQPPTGRANNVMYIRAKDSAQFMGPITARSFSV